MFSKHVAKDISAYCHGELSGEDSRRFAEHIISCGRCRTRFDEIKRGIKLAEQLPLISAPEQMWRELEPLLERGRAVPLHSAAPHPLFLKWKFAAMAAGLLVLGCVGAWWFFRGQSTGPSGPSWQVQRLDGLPRIGSEGISSRGELGIGEWLETDDKSRAQIAVGSIGNVDIDANTRVRLLETQPLEHRLELARGKMSARIWAPPRLFFVDTPSAVAADLGCAYTLEVDDQGAGLLRVTSGWVALQLKDRESIVPAGAACETRPGVGPGTPYFEDCAGDFRRALADVDFGYNAEARASALDLMLRTARPRDTLTLWHLLSRVEGNDRVRVYEKIAAYIPLPAGATREGILQLDRRMLELWKDELRPAWSEGWAIPKEVANTWWRLKNGVGRRIGKLK